MMAFDGSKKSEWLYADINGLLHTWMGMVVSISVLFVLAETAGFGVFEPLRAVANGIDRHWCSGWGFWTMVFAPAIPSFLIVFVFRRNYMVIGPRRQFRYICRWL